LKGDENKSSKHNKSGFFESRFRLMIYLQVANLGVFTFLYIKLV
jgi:hypothetical protein